ncbi:Uncharacterised protein [Yersinia pekkanenii]|nr:Uncharacterised protein [Yersinia pekkanenii]
MLVVTHVPDIQPDNADQGKELVLAQDRILKLQSSVLSLQARNQELEAGLQQLSEDAEALKSANEIANATITGQQQEIDGLKAQIVNLTPAPDAATNEPADTKTTKTTK